MKDNAPRKPELKVLGEEDEIKKLDRPDPSTHSTDSDSAEVEVLRPRTNSEVRAKTFEPDVGFILGYEEEDEVDTESSWGESVKKAPPIGWFVLAGIVLCGLLFWASLTVFQAKPKLEHVNEEKQEILTDKIKETKEVKKVASALEKSVRGYLAATTIDEKLRYVRHPERVKPLMEKYYQTHPIQPTEFRYFLRMRSLGIENKSFVYGHIELLNGMQYQILLEQLNEETFKVDWESDVSYQPIAWDDFLESKPTNAYSMRVYLQTDHFYAYQFRDDSKYDCYKITARDSDEYLFAYAVKGTNVAADLRRYIQDLRENGIVRAEPVILKIRFPDGGHSKKCVWIDQLVERRWTHVNPPETVTSE